MPSADAEHSKRGLGPVECTDHIDSILGCNVDISFQLSFKFPLVAQFPAEYNEGRVPPFSPVSLLFPFISFPFCLPVTSMSPQKPYHWLPPGAPVRAPIVPFPVPARVASPKWLNMSRLGRNTRTRGTVTSQTQTSSNPFANAYSSG